MKSKIKNKILKIYITFLIKGYLYNICYVGLLLVYLTCLFKYHSSSENAALMLHSMCDEYKDLLIRMHMTSKAKGLVAEQFQIDVVAIMQKLEFPATSTYNNSAQAEAAEHLKLLIDTPFYQWDLFFIN